MAIPDADQLHDRCFYAGNSMFRVFTPGDRLQIVPIKSEDLQKGDVVCFYRDQHWVVHRVIVSTPTLLQTMGDNNPQPDLPLTAEERRNLFKVTGVEFGDGQVRRIIGGRAGMRLFYRHRLQRRGRHWAAPLFHLAERLAFWKIPLTETRSFGTEVHYCFRGRSIACRKADGRVIFFRMRDRLRFRVAALKKKAAESAGKS